MAEESTNEFAQLEITEVIEKLGGLREEFRPHPGNLIVGIIVGTICVLLGVSIVVYFLALRQVRDDASMVLAGIGVLFMVSGTIAILTSNRRRSYRMLICANGFANVHGGRIKAARWEEIQRVEITEKGPRELQMYSNSKTARIIFAANGRIDFDKQTVSDLDGMLESVREHTDKLHIPWKVTKRPLGPFGLTS